MTPVRLRHYRIDIPDLPQAFQNYRILQLSDLHLGRRSPTDHSLSHIRQTHADMIALTGDICHRPEHAAVVNEFLTDLADAIHPRHGFIAVAGNHDRGLAERLDPALPLRWLNNQCIQLHLNSDRINIIGLDQQRWDSTDICRAIDDLEPDKPTVALCHYPTSALLMTQIADLVIAGHTHGGQIKLPFLPYFTNDCLGWKFGHGLSQFRKTRLIVSAGLGYSGPLPLRFFAPPELVAVTLYSPTN